MKKLHLPLLATCFVVATTRDSFAYIDPATGSFVLQMLIAGFLGELFALKLFWKRVKGFFCRMLSREKGGE